MIIALGQMAAWLFTGHWIPTNMIAVSIAITGMMFTRIGSMKIAFILLWLFFIYDVFWVFLSHFIFGTSVMLSVAGPVSQLSLPLVIAYPRIFAKYSYSLLGLGDIVLPGLFISYLYRLKSSTAIQLSRAGLSYYAIALIGYVTGFVVTIAMLVVIQSGQPALLYLVPGIFIPVTIVAWRRGELRTVWSPPPLDPAPDVEQGQAPPAELSSPTETLPSEVGGNEDPRPDDEVEVATLLHK
eukprot:TRINITY_DN14833_c0_g1_i3.p1 TRINITY_DN14833_c0_g1~~TRINITY_DN14833_c0_g1_i3.p1  ORF type:complete len:240 (+),score=48.54 TRINITY_DN14833_c0_g1_i3:526-1245(+)